MLTEGGQRSPDIDQAKLRAFLETEPYSVHFFQMVRLLAKLHPERKPVGVFASPSDEIVRFNAKPSLVFPPSSVGTYDRENGKPDSLEVAFMGLNVVNGPMPRAYTETLLARTRAKDHATAEFFDVFNHRLVSLFYRSWARYRMFIAYESAQGGEDEITRRLYDLVGIGTPGLRNRMAIQDESALYFAGLIGQRVRSAAALAQILEEYFSVQVTVRQFTGSWVSLAHDQQTVLRDGTSSAECLGMGTVVGSAVWNSQQAITIRLGPMPLVKYRDFLPGARGQKELEAWLRFYSRRAFDFVVQLLLARDEVPRIALEPSRQAGARLSYESWLKVKPMRRDPDEMTYILQ